MNFSNCKTMNNLTMEWQKAIKDKIETDDIADINRAYMLRKYELFNSNKSIPSNIEPLVPISISAKLNIGNKHEAVLNNNILNIKIPFVVQESKSKETDKDNTFIFNTLPYPNFSVK